MDDVMRQKWHELFRGWAVDSTRAGRAFDDVVNRYSDPSRFYHTLDHVRAVLETVERSCAVGSKLEFREIGGLAA